MTDITDQEIITYRESAIRDLPDQHGFPLGVLKEKFLNVVGYSEIFHTANMLYESVEHYLTTSPCVVLDEESYRHAMIAADHLFNLYQRMDRLRSELEEPPVRDDGPFPAGLTAKKINAPSEQWTDYYIALGASIIQPEMRKAVADSLKMFSREPEPYLVTPHWLAFDSMIDYLEYYPHLIEPKIDIEKVGDSHVIVFFYSTNDIKNCHETVTVKFSAEYIGMVSWSHNSMSDTHLGVENVDKVLRSLSFPSWMRTRG